VAAAAAYGRVLSSRWFLTDPARRDRALAAMAAPGSLTELETAQQGMAAAVATGPFGLGLGRDGSIPQALPHLLIAQAAAKPRHPPEEKRHDHKQKQPDKEPPGCWRGPPGGVLRRAALP